MPRMMMMLNREVRRVPMDWQHPQNERGQFVGLFPDDMPTGEAIRMYETTSEGTPMSAPYADTPEGRRAMAHELAHRSGGGFTSAMSEDEWLEVIDGQVSALDLHTGKAV